MFPPFQPQEAESQGMESHSEHAAKKRKIKTEETDDIYEELPRATPAEITIQVANHDEGVAFTYLLNIAHLRFDYVPSETMPVDTFYAIAVMCERYDCGKLVRPWITTWMPSNKDDGLKEPASLPKWLFIAWVLKSEKPFSGRSKAMVMAVAMSNDGKIVIRSHGQSMLRGF